ncbi:MAG: hypothetical protein GC149_12085 [Gammaproteobacteria bacterium]|nr:hypothetical protein [Gammaproteobacteria bacterium]
MISYIVRMIDEFKREHGYPPNLLYLNEFHLNHLKSALSDELSLPQMCELFQLELIVDREVMHPHVAWTHSADKLAI